MFTRFKLLLLLLGFMMAFSATGCAPVSKFPLSGEKTSVVDERLIGAWDVVDDKGLQEPVKDIWDGHKKEISKKPHCPLFVGRFAGKKNTLEGGYA